MNIILKYTVVLCLCAFVSCNNKQNTAKIDSLKHIIDNTLGEKLKIPDSLETYYPLGTTNNKKILQSELKIYTHIDASFSTCVESLKAWNTIIPELNKRNIQVNLICSSNNKFELLKYFFESKEIKNFIYPLLLDHNNQYITQNKFMLANKNFETVLINDDNEILLIGNPIITNEMKELYFSRIKNIHSKQL